ncbi:hypothetical protein JOJ86_006362 [Rhodococcus percolatus]|nr:hypothetical protein [Rhodococcus opacus]MBP2208636.1 hypothetical protein [Rhodococcus opacus]
MRGTPTRGPYDWWLISDIQSAEVGSWARTQDSASTSKVKAAAAVWPCGQVKSLFTVCSWGVGRVQLPARTSGESVVADDRVGGWPVMR